MRKLNVVPITNSAQYRVKKGTLQFLQDAYAESFAATIIALIGSAYDPAVVYILSGAVNSGTGTVYSISAGCIFFNGEIFYMDAAAFTATGTNVAVFQIDTTQYTANADPVTLTDSTVHNIHDIRKMQIVQGAPGSTIANFTQGFRLNFTIPAQLNLTQLTGVISGTDYTNNILRLIGAYPNLGLYVPPPATANFPVLASGYLNAGDAPGSEFTINITIPVGVGTNYRVFGTIISQGTPSLDDAATFCIRNKTNTTFVVRFNEYQAEVQNIGFDWIVVGY